MCFSLSSLNLIYASSIPSILPAFSFASNPSFFIFLHPSSFPLSLYQNVFLHFSFIPIHSLLSIHKFSILQSSCSNISLSSPPFSVLPSQMVSHTSFTLLLFSHPSLHSPLYIFTSLSTVSPPPSSFMLTGLVLRLNYAEKIISPFSDNISTPH